MEINIAVIAKDSFDYKDYFEDKKNSNVIYIMIFNPNQMRGITFCGVIITPRAKYEDCKIKLYNDCLKQIR